MLVLKERLIGVPIMSLQTGSEIAQTDAPIIDPRFLRIHAFYCQGARLDSNPAILHVDDIREVSGRGFIVNSANNLMPPDDLVRLQEIIDFNFELDGKLVVDERGHKLGKVGNYSVDGTTFYITQLSVTPHFWRAITTTELRIARSQIVEVNDDKIIVKSPTVKAREHAAPAPRPIVENPFRRPHPQPDSMSSDEQN